MYDALLKFAGGSSGEHAIKKITIPHIPPQTTPKFNIFLNKKLHNLERLENTLHYWLEVKNIDKNVKLQIYFDILKSLNKTFRDKRVKQLNSRYNIKRKAVTPSPEKAATPSPEKVGWSSLLDSNNTKNPKKLKTK